MRPEFAKAVDPIFQTALQFLNRVERGDKLIAGDQRALLLRKFDEAESILGNTDEWNLAKYALCAWIDSQLIHAPWQGNKWWVDNCLEVKFFGHHLAHEDFYRRAMDAGRLSRKDALEVFYLAVVLGFRGFYADQDAGYAVSTSQALKLPSSVEEWCRSIAISLQLRQGRPIIPEPVQAGGSAKPLNGRTVLLGVSMLSILLIALAIGCGLVLFGKKDDLSTSMESHGAVLGIYDSAFHFHST